MAPHLLPLRVLIVCGLAYASTLAAVSAPVEPLTDAATVLSLTAERAGRRLKITVTGVVTAAEPDWDGQFFVQDSTGGVFVENISRRAPKPGDRVTVSGVSHPGAFAPIISEPNWEILGTAPLPEAKPVLIETLESGVEDGQRVEVSGVVRSVRREGSRWNLELAVGGYRLQVSAPVSGVENPDTLVATRVRVRGTAATHYNAALRHLTAVAVYVPRPEDFLVLEAEAMSPFTQPVLPLNSVAQYRRESGTTQRVHVRGAVTLQRIGEDVFLQDGSGGLRIETKQVETFAVGDVVEAVGFLEYENFLPLLRDAALKKTSAVPAPARPQSVPINEIRNGLHHAELITLSGRILDRSTRPVTRDAAHFSGFVTTWLLQGDGLSFTVEHEEPVENPVLATIPIGSLVEVDGVGVTEVDSTGKTKNLKLLLAASSGLHLLARPSWWTPRRLIIGVGLLSTILLVVVAWLLTVARKNAALSDTLRELERAQRELQEAHDTLEQKIIERSAQLQVEMTARKTAELQFKAVLAERTRLARDLHDSLEQTLTGIALQLDTAAKLFERNPIASNHHLELARNWLRQSQVELRRSIWDLRTRELEQFDLANALRQSAEHLIDGTAMQLEFTTRGEKRALPEVVEENILRIGQEALTNIAKHAQALRVNITLEFSPSALLLLVSDNGIGFASPETSAPGDNRFGLLGMSERAKRLGGRVVINSIRGRGTAIEVEIPIEPLRDSPSTRTTKGVDHSP
jgi:signal transduction histidine kinase